MLSVNHIAAISAAAAHLRATGQSDLATRLDAVLVNEQQIRDAAAAARRTRATGKRGAPCRRYVVAMQPGNAWVELGAKATAARLAKVLHLAGSTRTAPSAQVLGAALARAGQWQCQVETDNGLAMVTVGYAD